MRPARAEDKAEDVAEDVAKDEAVAALRLVAAGLVVAVLVVVLPAAHAARDRLAAQVVRAAAAKRYMVMAVLSTGVRVAESAAPGGIAPNLGVRLAGRITNVSQACNSVRDPGTAAGLPGHHDRARAASPVRSATLF
jgi:hypothetical protein